MPSPSLSTRIAALAAGVALSWGCSTEPAKPAALTIVSGDSQSGLTGSSLGSALVVGVVGSDGSAFQGAGLSWLASGGATVTPSASISDVGGQSTGAVTLGGAGPVTVSATVEGLAPVTFHLTSVSVCAWRVPVAFNTSTTTGALATNDCKYPDGTFIDYYSMVTTIQQGVRIRMFSNSFDAYLFFYDNVGVPVAEADDDATSSNPDMLAIVGPGTYVIGANAYDVGATGSYTLTTQSVAEAVGSCAPWFVTPNIFTNQQLSLTDCGSAGYYADGMIIFLQSGRTYTFTQTSSAFDAYLFLQDFNGTVLANDDNSAGGQNARLTFTPSVSNAYIIFPSSALAGKTGAYTLAISVSSTAAGAAPNVLPLAAMRRPGAFRRAVASLGASRRPR